MLLDTPLCDFGWPAPDFKLKDAHGVETQLSDVKGKNAFLIAFICNHCPYVQRIAHAFAKETKALRAQGIETIAIMSNDYRTYPEDAPPKMIEFAKHYGFEFPYLIDEDQSVGKAYGAVCTPDFFGFDANGGLQYRGRFEEGALSDAMVAIAKTGHGPEVQIPSMGCSIKWQA